MAASKYGKYIVTRPLTEAEVTSRGRTLTEKQPGAPYAKGQLYLDDGIIKGAFYMEVDIIEPGSKRPDVWVKAHTHEQDEIIGFAGTDPKNPQDLKGENFHVTARHRRDLSPVFALDPFGATGKPSCGVNWLDWIDLS